MTQTYPLSWPIGWQRTGRFEQQRAKFSKLASHGYSYKQQLTVADALARLFSELNILGASEAVVSTNIETRLDGTPRSDRREPVDSGVAVYFKLRKQNRVLACDKWDRVADNIAAIAAHIDAIRRQDRYGVGTMDQAFAGYAALPAPGATPEPRPWHEVLGVDPNASRMEAETEFKRRAKVAHPDNGGTAARMSELNAAISEARRMTA